MRPSILRLLKPPLHGALAALGFGAVLFFAIALFIGKGTGALPPRVLLPTRFLRLLLPLALSGALCGFVFLRYRPDASTLRRVLLFGVSAATSIVLTILAVVVVNRIRTHLFTERVFAAAFPTGTPESAVRQQLGPPAVTDDEPDLFPLPPSSPCLQSQPLHSITYILPEGGPFRTFYFDHSGRLCCDLLGIVH